MDKKISDALNTTVANFIFPFLWVRGEEKERIAEEILAIRNSGISEFCVECRPYEQFCKAEWWDYFGFILSYAKKLNMRVWLLDDRHFPTGFANGCLARPENAHLRKLQIRNMQTTVAGPVSKAKILIENRIDTKTETVIRILAYKQIDSEELLDAKSCIDLTDKLYDGAVYWDIPDGVWRVCTVIRTNRINCDIPTYIYMLDSYIDMLNPASCHKMIEEIYQPHYEHFGEYFGNTFRGFFSDEPAFLNRAGTSLDTLGIMYDTYPWRDDLPDLLSKESGLSVAEIYCLLPALWEDFGNDSAAIRYSYMNVITKLYRDNFSNALGDWCRAHHVMYIGHVIEDSNAHMRLSHGCGHYFRALEGQDMAGIDIVLGEFIPGVTDCVHRTRIADQGYTDTAFFRYTLPKLAASHARLQPLKQGRAMCELFGAFGWAEGLPYMKQMADFMLASGINHFVPHAFSAKEDDPDCPPHFYNGGRNPQYPLFKRLAEYMNRTSHILFGGRHIVSAAVYYNADGEWCGGKNQLFQYVAKQLTQNLIDFDIVPFDILKESAQVTDSKLVIQEETFGALVVSESEILPFDLLFLLAEFAKKGLPVIFTESLPSQSAEKRDIPELLQYFTAVPTQELAQYLRGLGIYDISVKQGDASHLRFHHIIRESSSVYMFSNEDAAHDLNVTLTLPDKGDYLVYDAWSNRCFRGNSQNGELPLHIEKGNALMIAFDKDIPETLPYYSDNYQSIPCNIRFDISVRDAKSSEFIPLAHNSACFDITAPDKMPHFNGEILYRGSFSAIDGYTVLDLGEVGETAAVTLNGKEIGCRVNPPYRFDLSEALSDGENQLEISVIANNAHALRDLLSGYSWLPPSGIIGDISLLKYL